MDYLFKSCISDTDPETQDKVKRHEICITAFKKHFGRQKSFYGTTDTPVLGLLMMSPLGFKVRVGSLGGGVRDVLPVLPLLQPSFLNNPCGSGTLSIANKSVW